MGYKYFTENHITKDVVSQNTREQCNKYLTVLPNH